MSKYIPDTHILWSEYSCTCCSKLPPYFERYNPWGEVPSKNQLLFTAFEMYRSQIAPYDALILEELGGGGIHACGNLQNQCPEFLGLPGIKCLDFGQSYLNEIDAVYEQAKEKSIALLRVQVPKKDLTTGRVMERFPTGVTLLHEAKSLDDAGRIMEQYREASA